MPVGKCPKVRNESQPTILKAKPAAVQCHHLLVGLDGWLNRAGMTACE
jgi:hypothetical protein